MIKRPPLRIAIAAVIIVILALALLYNINGAGFHEKTLWDWLNLLIVPLILAVGGIFITATIQRTVRERAQERERREREQAERRAQVEQQLVDDHLKEQTLQKYLDRMSELLLKGYLDNPATKDNARIVARAWTLTTLRSLNKERKAAVLQFLYESNLIVCNEPVVDLKGANFAEINLQFASLKDSHLEGVNLNGANLAWARLHNGNLRGASLIGADLASANLESTNLSEAYLWDSKLQAACLDGTNLRSAQLYKANLENASLQGAELKWAHLAGANFKRASVTSEQLATAHLDGGTILPDGSHYKPRSLGMSTEPSQPSPDTPPDSAQ